MIAAYARPDPTEHGGHRPCGGAVRGGSGVVASGPGTRVAGGRCGSRSSWPTVVVYAGGSASTPSRPAGRRSPPTRASRSPTPRAARRSRPQNRADASDRQRSTYPVPRRLPGPADHGDCAGAVTPAFALIKLQTGWTTAHARASGSPTGRLRPDAAAPGVVRRPGRCSTCTAEWRGTVPNDRPSCSAAPFTGGTTATTDVRISQVVISRSGALRLPGDGPRRAGAGGGPPAVVPIPCFADRDHGDVLLVSVANVLLEGGSTCRACSSPSNADHRGAGGRDRGDPGRHPTRVGSAAAGTVRTDRTAEPPPRSMTVRALA